MFSEQYANLRQLCCHPGSGRWMSRLDRGGAKKEFTVLSLDQLRARMVTWKKEDVEQVHHEIGQSSQELSGGQLLLVPLLSGVEDRNYFC